MAEVVATIGLISSIAQLVQLCADIVARVDEFALKTSEVPKSILKVRERLVLFSRTLQKIESQVTAGVINEQEAKSLEPIVRRSLINADGLKQRIEKVRPDVNSSKFERGVLALRSFWNDGKVQNIVIDLDKDIHALTFYQITSHTDRIEQVRQELSRLKTTEHHPRQRPSSTVPFSRDRDFTSRDEFEQLWRRRNEPALRIALVGLGGVGKSQLAIEFAYRIRDERPDLWVFWVHASTTTWVEEWLRKIAEKTQVSGWDGAKANTLEVVSRWLENEDNGPWVLIIDNADEKDTVCDPWRSQQQDQIGHDNKSLLEYLPQTAHGSIVMTSRSHEVAFELTGSSRDVIEVPPMNPTTALDLLRKKLQVGANIEEEKALVQSVEFIPLAITQAAALISRHRMTVSKYVQELQRGDQERTRLLEHSIRDLRRDGKSSNSIIKTWHISFEYIGRVRPSAARLLAFMSCFDREAIPEDLLNKQKDFDFEEDVRMLQDYCLIGENIGKGTFEMHRLVQFSTIKWLEMRKELGMWQERYVVTLVDVFPSGNYENWEQCQMLFPHVEIMITYQVERARWATVLYRASWYAREQGWYYKAEKMAWESLEARKAVLGREHPDTLTSMASLALTYWSQGRWKEAEELEVQVMETRKRVLGPEHPDTLTSMANLASTYRNQGRWKEAEELEAQVMETSLRVLEPEHPSTLTSMANLASTYRNQGRWKEAEELDVQVMETSLRVLGPEHPDTLTSMANLASTYRNQGRWKEAEELEVQVMETRKRVLEPEHPSTLTSLANLASTYRNQGRWKEAEELDVQVMETSLRVLEPEHPSTLTSMANLASTYRNQGRWKEAEELDVQVMETSLRVLGPEHPDTLNSMNNLASTFWKQGRWKEAEELEVQVMETSLRVLEPEHPSTLTSMANLASTYRNQGRWKEAEELDVQVMETSLRVLGPEHPDTLNSMNNLASTYRNQGRWKEAEELDVQVMETSLRVLGPEHPDTLTSMNNLAWTRKHQNRHDEARNLLVSCLEKCTETLGPEHPHTQSVLDTLVEWSSVMRDETEQGSSGVPGAWVE